jgi:ABC-type glycerol-3-phosphate transport system substrate-binding protein
MILFRQYFGYPINLIVILVVVAIAFVSVFGCQTSPGEEEPTSSIPSPTEVTATPFPVETPTARVSPTVTATATPEDNTIVLTFWTIESISPEAEGESGDFISNSLRGFRRTNPDVEINLVLKKASGKGGVVDFLRTAKEVAPAVMPDIAIMNATDLNQALSDNLIQSLDGRLDRSIVQDLLPAARKMGTVNDRLVGVPLGLEMQHVVYNTLVFTDTPMLWTDIFTKNTRYLFPAKGVNGLVNDATLFQYFSAGGELIDDQGELEINEQALRRVLDTYQQALDNGTIDPSILEASVPEELWPVYLEGRAGMSQITVQKYLTDRELLNNSIYAAGPVIAEDDTPVAITHGWVLVLVTDDPARQKAALSLMEWFLSTNNNATWNNINKSIPSRDTAFQQLASGDPYWGFLSEQLNTARPQPGFTGYDQFGRIVQQAVQQVISGEASPEEATATAIDALAP